MIVIKQQPKDWYGNIGETAVYHIAAEGSSIKYQWQYAMLTSTGSENAEFKNSSDAGCDSDTFSIIADESRMKLRLYRCILTDGTGDRVVSSAVGVYPLDMKPPETTELVSLSEMKQYLRVDYEEDDSLIEGLIHSSVSICMDIIRTDDIEVLYQSECAKTAVMYATAYMYEHREEADHHGLMLTLRALLFGSRREGF